LNFGKVIIYLTFAKVIEWHFWCWDHFNGDFRWSDTIGNFWTT